MRRLALPIPFRVAAHLPALRYRRTLRSGTYTNLPCFLLHLFPGGRERPPYNARQTGGGTRGRRAWQVDDSHGVSPLCVGADACIGPRYSAGGCRFRVISRSRPQCRAGDLARRMGGLRRRKVSVGDDASIVPYGCGGKALPGF